MTPHPETAFFAGIDWGSQSHHACVSDADGTVLGEQEFKHSGSGLGLLIDWILARTHTGAGQVRVAIEILHGPVVDSMMDRGFPVYPINPKQLDRFRDRFSPSGAKDDRRNAPSAPTRPACTSGPAWRTISPEHANRIRERLWCYYPQFLELGADLAADWTLALWKLAPTPDAARRIRLSTVAKLLKRRRLRCF